MPGQVSCRDCTPRVTGVRVVPPESSRNWRLRVPGQGQGSLGKLTLGFSVTVQSDDNALAIRVVIPHYLDLFFVSQGVSHKVISH